MTVIIVVTVSLKGVVMNSFRTIVALFLGFGALLGADGKTGQYEIILMPPGRVGIDYWGNSLRGTDARVYSWELISPTGALFPDADGNASPWEQYLSNTREYIHAYSDPFRAVGLKNDYLGLDVGGYPMEFDFWYTTVNGIRRPGPIFPLSGWQYSGGIDLVVDLRDGSMTITEEYDEDNSWTYGYSIESLSASLIPDGDGNAAPYLTYLSNTAHLIEAATSNAVVLGRDLHLDSMFNRTTKDLIFRFERLGDEYYSGWLSIEQGNVYYVPAEVPATDFTLFRGILVGGDLPNTFTSDDVRMRFSPGITHNLGEAPVWLIFDANLSSDSPSSLVLKVEAQAGTPGLTATTEVWNWNTNSYDLVNVSATSFNNDTVVTATLNPGDHVQSETAAVCGRGSDGAKQALQPTSRGKHASINSFGLRSNLFPCPQGNLRGVIFVGSDPVYGLQGHWMAVQLRHSDRWRPRLD